MFVLHLPHARRFDYLSETKQRIKRHHVTVSSDSLRYTYLLNSALYSYKLRYIVGFGLVEMAISTNPKPTIYRNLCENTGLQIVSSAIYFLELTRADGTKSAHVFLISKLHVFHRGANATWQLLPRLFSNWQKCMYWWVGLPIKHLLWRISANYRSVKYPSHCFDLLCKAKMQ